MSQYNLRKLTMSDISYSSLKISHQVRESEEKKALEKKRQLLYLVLHYLKDEGFFDTAECLSNEAHLTNQYQICDNIDLGIIVQDFETYYYVRFQKYPKICKKICVEENRKNMQKKTPYPENEIQDTTKPRTTSVQNEIQKESKLHVTKSFGKTSSIGIQKTIKRNTPLSDLNLTVLPITHEGFTNMETDRTQSNVQDSSSEKLLKPQSGYSNYNAEWKEFAEIISKEICVMNHNVHWNDIMGLEEAKRLLREAVVYPTKYPELFSGVLAPWKGVLLYGPPGTGKTLLAKAVATECKTTFFNISASSIVSKWRGESEKLVRVMFELARYHAPSTIFLDELDALASHRDASREHEGSRRLKAELLIQLDGLAHSEDKIFFLATSNLPWELDAAILRRLEKRILVDLPNAEARQSMIQHYLPYVVIERPALLCQMDYGLVAHASAGYSGSDIRLVCKEAAMNALREAFSVLETCQNGKYSHLPSEFLNLQILQPSGMTQCSLVDRCQCFRRTCCLLSLQMEAPSVSLML
ncbi:katanin p60 ATPase-containing subunit A-like 2 isoform X1 [Cryptotermes secundus]|uniref:katanin p60 ATPase-containing subunit A-like 2 isoform X1 n=1 Tax=Cryptotermes secundus TaxID=105785 RepID=UPI000CD7D872|nr:katanin p60 ATPase-containing subunit A-like 2 isoform X1 [Cryptotermes secundus]